MKKIYTLSGIQYDIDKIETMGIINSEIIYGYFSNLKKVYSIIEGTNIGAYSTVARKIKSSKSVTLVNISIKLKRKTLKLKRVTIKIEEFNKIYITPNSINLERIIIGDMKSK
jgi:hypothetical protein